MSTPLAKIRCWSLKRFTVIVDCLEEPDLDLSWDETGEVASKLESGELVAFCVRVRVLLDGNELACDYLDECIYPDFADFMDHAEVAATNRELARKGETARVAGSNFADMVHSTIAEARRHLEDYKPPYVRYAKKGGMNK